jgi:hypothetical protein
MAVQDPDKLVADIDRQQNEEDKANLNKYIIEPVKSFGKRIKDNVMGTEAQNKYYEDKEAKAKSKGMKSGGKVKSASSRADGIAIRGKTRA